MCSLELFFRMILFIVLSLVIIQLFCQKESFHPWNKYGSVAINYMPSRGTTGTTRFEYNYVYKPFEYKNNKTKNNTYPVFPITKRQFTS